MNGQDYNELDKKVDNKKEELAETKENFLKELWEYLKMMVFVVAAVLIVNQFVLINARIPSGSMENTIQAGDQIFGNRLAYLFDDPERLDIVIFKYPDDRSQYFIKRVIGLPGETVEIIDGDVYVTNTDGEEMLLDETYLPEDAHGTFGPYTVPEDCYFMLGDNRNWSKDSRFWTNTFVPKEDILGKAALRYWPLNKIGFVK